MSINIFTNRSLTNMKNNKGLNFFFLLIAIIVGSALFKQFDFKNLKFEKPALAIVYLLTFGFSLYFLIKHYKNKPKSV